MKATIKKLETGQYVLELPGGSVSRPYASKAAIKRKFPQYEYEEEKAASK